MMKGNVPSRKKSMIPVRAELRDYLRRHNRAIGLPIQYRDLLRYESSVALLDLQGNDTLWETVYFS